MARFAKPLQGSFSPVAKHPQKHKNRPEIGRFSHFNPSAEMHPFSLFSASKAPEKWLCDAICRKKQLFPTSRSGFLILHECLHNIGMRIKELRMGRNLTQAALGRKINRSKTVISNYEMGIRMPTVDSLCELALFFGVSVDYLLGLEKRRMLPIEGLNTRQVEILTMLASEFKNESRSKKK